MTQFREALEEFRTQNGGGGFVAAMYRSDLGECLTKFNQFAEAEHKLLEARRVTMSTSHEHERVQDAVRRLASLYEAWGKPKKAAEYLTMLPQ